MKRYYPAFLDLSGKNVLVVGGGEVACRKIKTLFQYHSNLFVVAKSFGPKTRDWVQKKGITFHERNFQPADLRGKDLVFCATDDHGLNKSVSRQCKKNRIWVNTADQMETCSFIVPSIVQRGEISVAISTGGASPALAKYLRKKIETAVGPEFGFAAGALKKARKKILKIPMNRRKKILNKILEAVDHGKD